MSEKYFETYVKLAKQFNDANSFRPNFTKVVGTTTQELKRNLEKGIRDLKAGIFDVPRTTKISGRPKVHGPENKPKTIPVEPQQKRKVGRPSYKTKMEIPRDRTGKRTQTQAPSKKTKKPTKKQITVIPDVTNIQRPDNGVVDMIQKLDYGKYRVNFPDEGRVYANDREMTEDAIKVLEHILSTKGVDSDTRYLIKSGHKNPEGLIKFYAMGNNDMSMLDNIKGNTLQDLIRLMKESIKYGDPFFAYENHAITSFMIIPVRSSDNGAFKLRESINYNCVLQAIRDAQKTKPTKAGALTLEDKVNLWVKKTGFNPETDAFTKDHVESMYNQSAKNAIKIVVHCMFGIWYQPKKSIDLQKENKPTIHIYGHDGHATLFKPTGIPQKQVVLPPGSREDCLLDICKKHHQAIEYLGGYKQTREGCEFITKGAIIGDTIYKLYNIPDEKYKDDPRFFYCLSDIAYLFKKWKIENKYTKLPPTYFEIFKQADVHVCRQRLQPFDVNLPMYDNDMHMAFASYETSPLYPMFKIVTGFCSLFNVVDNEPMEYLSKPGASRVTKILYIHPLLEKIQHIKIGEFRNNIILYGFVTRGYLKIECDLSCICVKPVDLSIPHKDNKPFRNMFIGNLIAGASDNGKIFRHYYVKDEMEREQIIHNASMDKSVISATVDVSSEWITLEFQTKKEPVQLHQIHSCMLAYQQLEFITKMIETENNGELVVCYNTDGFFTRNRVFPDIDNKDLNPGQFRNKGFEIPKSCYTDQGVHSVNVTVDIDFDRVPRFNTYKDILSPKIYIYGEAGCGKSYTFIEKEPLYNSHIGVPTNILKVDLQKKCKYKVTTIHRAIPQEMNPRANQKQVIFNQLIIDEATMVNKCDFKSILEHCNKHELILIMIGDLDPITKEIYQRGPAMSKPISKFPEDFIFIKKESHIKRQSQEDFDKICELRYMEPEEHINYLKQFCKVVESLPKFDHNKPYSGISSRHMYINELNIMANKNSVNPKKIWAKYVGKSDDWKTKGELKLCKARNVWSDRKSATEKVPKKFIWENAYFRTADAVQGQSIDNQIIIDLRGVNSRGYIYTAVSRCRRLSDVILYNLPATN